MRIARPAAGVVTALAVTTLVGCASEPAARFRIIDASDGPSVLSWVGDVDPVVTVFDDTVQVELCGQISWSLRDDGTISEPTSSDGPCTEQEATAREWLEAEGPAGGTWTRDPDMLVMNADPRMLILELHGSP